MTATTAFNASVTTFQAELEKATQAFEKNPGDIAPLSHLAEKIQRQRRQDAMDLISLTSSPVSFAPLADIMAKMSAATEGADERSAIDNGQRMIDFMETVQQQLAGMAVATARQKDDVTKYRDRQQGATGDCAAFSAAIAGLMKNRADDARFDRDGMERLSRDAVMVLSDLTTNGQRLDTMLEMSDSLQAKVAGLSANADAMTAKIKTATEGAIEVQKTVKEFIESCASGISAPVTVRRKPLTLTRPATVSS